MKRAVYIVLLLILISLQAFPKPKRVATIPFRLVGSSIVIETTINESSPLNLILDTGVKNTMITEILPEDSVDLPTGDIVQIRGLGVEDSIRA